ncbi:MAG: hypothetical protein MJY98_13115, partial [Fibrobacter sp.]|nr:hypothetical protein [Fibrobacter sp.]
TGVGDHEEKYKDSDDEVKTKTADVNAGKKTSDAEGDEQFEINDNRSFNAMYKDISGEGLQPVLNDYLYV